MRFITAGLICFLACTFVISCAGSQANQNLGAEITDAPLSGVRGTTISEAGVGAVSALRYKRRIPGKMSLLLAVAPVENDKPLFNKAHFFESNENGEFSLPLRPGQYWIGTKEAAIREGKFPPGGVDCDSRIFTVEKEAFTALIIRCIALIP
jgi:hypothetical protein